MLARKLLRSIATSRLLSGKTLAHTSSGHTPTDKKFRQAAEYVADGIEADGRT